MSQSDIPRLEKFDDYPKWREDLTSLLLIRGKRSWDVVNGDFVENKNKVDEKFIEANSLALSTLRSCIGDDFSYLYQDKTDAKEIWEGIKKAFTKNLTSRVERIEDELNNLRQGPKDSVDKVASHILTLCKLLKEANRDISYERRLMILAKALNPKLGKYKEMIYHDICESSREISGVVQIGEKGKTETVPVTLSKEDPKVKYERTLDELRAREEHIRQEEDDNPRANQKDNARGVAYYTKNDENDRKTSRSQRECWVCGEAGHIARQCSQKKGNSRRFPPRTHEDPKKDQDKKPGNNKNQEEAYYLNTGEASRNDVEQEIYYNADSTKARWILDSGSSIHVCNDHRLFKTLTRGDYGNVRSGSGETTSVKGTGEVVLLPKGDDTFGKLTLRNVRYIPDFNVNLISVGIIRERSCVIFHKDGGEIKTNKGDIVCRFHKENNMSLLDVDCQTTEETFFTEVVKGDMADWHARLGHASYQLVKETAAITQGMQLENRSERPACETCSLGKSQHRTDQRGWNTTTEPLELVHSDVMGKMPHEAFDGNKYAVTFIDDYSRFVTVFLMKRKSEVLGRLMTFKSTFENLTGKKLKRFRSDNGGEYTGHSFKGFLTTAGVIQEFTAPYEPEQNGTAKRMNRSLCTMACCMLIECGGPYALWGDALLHATYVKNRLPMRKGAKHTPIELFLGQVPTTALLKPFGCTGYVHLTPQELSKFGPRSRKAIYLGVQPGTKAYRMLFLEDMTWHTSKQVKFNENKFPFKMPNFSGEVDRLNIQFLLNDDNDDPLDNDGFGEDDDRFPVYHTTFNTDQPEPRTLSEAKHRLDWPKWKEAVDNELASHKENGTWELVPTPQGTNIVSCKWVFKLKRHPDGSIDKYKARLVARGFTQREGIDYDETFAPVMRFHTLRMLLCLANEYDLLAHQMDVSTAFLNGKLKEDVYMESPIPTDGKVCKLIKSLYGLKQAGRTWYEHIDETLRRDGYIRSHADSSLYIKHPNDMNKKIIIGLYVDDVVIVSKSQSLIDETKVMLRSKYKMTDGGPISHILGIQVIRSAGVMRLSQSHYVKSLGIQFLPDHYKTEKAPLVEGIEKRESNDAPLDAAAHARYRSIVGSLQYAAQGTRPDIAFAIQFLSQTLHIPTEGDLRNAEHTVRYLKATEDVCIQYERQRSRGSILSAYSDADWASDPLERRSISGVVLTLFGGPVIWQSKKQELVTDSTAYAEYVAMYHATKDILWARNVLCDMGHGQNDPTPLFTDNAAAKSLAENPKDAKRTKHFDIKFHLVREQQTRGAIEARSIGTKAQIADILTKSFNGEKQKIGLHQLNLVRNSQPMADRARPGTKRGPGGSPPTKA